MADKKTDVSAAKDTGCAMYIRAAIVGKLKRHGHHTYAAGMTSMALFLTNGNKLSPKHSLILLNSPSCHC